MVHLLLQQAPVSLLQLHLLLWLPRKAGSMWIVGAVLAGMLPLTC
jgi:hypothetical protein